MNRRTPKYRLHKPSGRAVVTIAGRDVYLGIHGSKESHAEYDRVLAEWLSAGRQKIHRQVLGDQLIVELLLAFDQYAETRYPVGSREPENFRYSLQPLRNLYGGTPARDFGPKSLKAVQQHMIQLGWCRNVINRRIGRVKSFFKWAESEELVPPATYHALQTVRGIPRGMPGVTETKPVEPAFWDEIEKVCSACASAVRAMLELQWLSAMRSGEVRTMRTKDLDTERSDVWFYRPGSDAGPTGAHKNTWRGHERVIALGPKAIAVLQPWLNHDNPSAFLFSPRMMMKKHIEDRRRNRKTPLPRNARLTKRRTKRRLPGELYSSNSYAQAVSRACRKAGVTFHPYQLRHGRKMAVEAAVDIDGARAVLGQRSIQSTLHYGRMDVRRAADIMKKLG